MIKYAYWKKHIASTYLGEKVDKLDETEKILENISDKVGLKTRVVMC